MSPTILEYQGIKIMIYMDDHLPIHVHAIYGNSYGARIEFPFKNGRVDKIEYKSLKGFKSFNPAQMRDVKKLVTTYQDQIIQAWFDIIKDKKIKKKTINIKLK